NVISSGLLHVSFANGLTLAQLIIIEAIETRFPELSLQGAFIDHQLSPRARSALAKFLRVPEDKVKAHGKRHTIHTYSSAGFFCWTVGNDWNPRSPWGKRRRSSGARNYRKHCWKHGVFDS